MEAPRYECGHTSTERRWDKNSTLDQPDESVEHTIRGLATVAKPRLAAGLCHFATRLCRLPPERIFLSARQCGFRTSLLDSPVEAKWLREMPSGSARLAAGLDSARHLARQNNLSNPMSLFEQFAFRYATERTPIRRLLHKVRLRPRLQATSVFDEAAARFEAEKNHGSRGCMMLGDRAISRLLPAAFRERRSA